MTARAVVDLLAGELHQLYPAAHDRRHHPIDPAAVEAAERLVDALAEQGLTVTVDRTA